MKQEEAFFPNKAMENWGKVRNILIKKQFKQNKREGKYNLFEKHTIEDKKQELLMTTYILEKMNFINYSPIPTLQKITAETSQIDTTGNWIWEAEEITAYYFLRCGKSYLSSKQKIQILKEGDKENVFKILEVGAGTSGLAGIALKKTYQNQSSKISLELTDGKDQNIFFLMQNLIQNKISEDLSSTKIMRWGDQQSKINLQKQQSSRVFYDLIIGCDCLFFEHYHSDLIITLNSYMNSTSKALFVNPKRGKSMQKFIDKIDQFGFRYKFIEFEDQIFQIQQKLAIKSKTFDEDRDLYYFILLQKVGHEMK